MAKNKKSSSVTKTPKKKKSNNKEIRIVWDELAKLSDAILADLYKAHTSLVSLYEANKEEIDKDPTSKLVFEGLNKNYTDLAGELAELRHQHTDPKDNTFFVGEVRDSDILNYNELNANYIYLSHKVVENASKGVLEALTSIPAVAKNEEAMKELNETKEAVNETMEVTNNMVNQIKEANNR